MSVKKAAAQAAARRGFPVFPLAENQKVPLIKNWPNLATTDPAQIDAWWDEWPDANIGCSTAGWLVVDIDPRNGGMETYAGLYQIETIPQTLTSRTQSGGHHAFFALPEGVSVKSGTHKLGAGVDVKSAGGYVVLPGSKIDGREYTWANERPIAPAPAWMIERCKRAKAKPDSAGKRIVEEDETAIEQAQTWIRERAPTATLGEIDDTTYKVAARLYDFGCSEETVLELMHEWNESHCDGLGDIERLPVVVESAGRNRDNPIGNRHRDAPGFEPVEIREREEPSKLSAPKPVEGMRAENFFAAADLALTDLAEPLIKGILDRGAMSILYGESNTGKTFIAIDLAFHVATGRPWTGRKTRKGCVVYVAAEGGRGVYKRLAALRKANPDLADVHLYVVKFPIDLLHGPEHARELVRICREVAEQSGQVLEIIVIDTLSRAMSGGDENSSTDMGGIVKSFDAIRDVTGAHLMVIHHSGKDRAKGARGHSLLRAATDTEIEVERGRVTVTKQRDMDGDFKQSFRLHSVNIGKDPDGGWVSSCVVEFITGQTAGEVAVPLTKTQLKTLDMIRRHIGNDPQKVFGWEFVTEIKIRHDSGKGASRQAVTEILEAISGSGELRKLQENQYVLN